MLNRLLRRLKLPLGVAVGVTTSLTMVPSKLAALILTTLGWLHSARIAISVKRQSSD